MNVEIAEDADLGSRAREILGSMKEKRESFTDKIASSRLVDDPDAKTQPVDTALIKPATLKAALFSPEETEAITNQLNASLKEKKARLQRMNPSTAPVSPLPRGTVGRTEPPAHLPGSPTLSSDHTRSTADSTASPDVSSSSIGFESTHLVFSSLPPQAPTLEEIREAFAEVSDASSCCDSTRSSNEDDKDSSSTCSREKSSPGMISAIVNDDDGNDQDNSIMDLKEPPLLHLNDVDIPPVIRSMGSWDSCSSVPAPVNSRPETPLSPASAASSLGSKQERAAYIGALYSSNNKRRSMVQSMVEATTSPLRRRRSQTGARLWERRNMHRHYIQRISSKDSISTPSTGGLCQQQAPQVVDLSVVRNHDQRRELLQSLQMDLHHHSPTSPDPEQFKASSSPPPRTHRSPNRHLVSSVTSPLTCDCADSLDDICISDVSSYNGSTTTDSNTSGWISDSDDASASLRLNNTSLLTDGFSDEEEELSLVSLPMDADLELHPQETSEHKKTKHPKPKPKPERVLFVSEKVADKHFPGGGGLYTLALRSGLCQDTPIDIKVVITKRSSSTRLSNDFRCGANGSHYDLCLKSGMPKKFPPVQFGKSKRTSRDPTVVAKGGLYDMALQSGWQDAMDSKLPISVSTKVLYGVNDDETVASERYTDLEAGASGGSLYLAMESGACEFETAGSLYYITERSGLELYVESL